MSPSRPRSLPAWVVGLIMIATGLAVFAIRMVHPGPYAMPHGGALYGALGAIALGVTLLTLGKLRGFGWIPLILSPIALFPALYSIMGESEEVISLYAEKPDGELAELRLWIVDRNGEQWLGMAKEKAVANRLDGAELQMLRQGEHVCVKPVVYEDRPTVRIIHGMKVEKYAVARIFGAVGLYPLEAPETTVVVRLDACD